MEACRWFNTNCNSYIRDDDLEDIAFMVSEAISSTSPSPFAFNFACLAVIYGARQL